MIKMPEYLTSFLQKLRSIPLNLRGKLILGNVLITFVAVISIGTYMYYRTQQADSYLTDQLVQSVLSKARTDLMTNSSEQALRLNSYFASISKDMTSLGQSIENLLSEQSSLSSGSYWDAATSLSRLPSGSWDNPDTEIASVFIPAAGELTPALASELNTLKYTEAIVPPILAGNPDIIAIYFGGTLKETVYYPNINLAGIVPADFDVTGRPWFTAAAPDQNPEGGVVWSIPYEDAALHGLVVTTSIPVYNDRGVLRGVAAMDIQLNRISDMVSSIRIGLNGYAFMIDPEKRLIAFPSRGYRDFGYNAATVPLAEVLDQANLANLSPSLPDVLNKVAAGESGLTSMTILGQDRFVVYRPLREAGYGLVMIAPAEEFIAEATMAEQEIARTTRNTITLSIALVAVILLVASLAALTAGNVLTAPLKNLTNTAAEITAGNLEAKAVIQTEDEIGVLGRTLNNMSSTLKGLIQSLEQRVADRTNALQTALQREERRSRQFEAITKVAHAAAAEQSTAVLLPQVCRVISEQFGYYHVGIFLSDANNQYAVLSASNSQGGQRMIERRHQLKIGEQGIVGYVSATSKPRVALDVGRDAVFFDNPDLPETRSEMALPLKIGDNTFGTLDVQSREPNAFNTEDIEILTVLADQVSLAIQNARLFDQTRKSLAEAEALYRQYLQQAWQRLPEEDRLAGFRYTISGVEEIPGGTKPLIGGNGSEPGELISQGQNRVFVEVPITLRGEKLGILKVEVPATAGKINPDQMDMIRAVAERVALSAENARLFNEATRRAQRERLVSEITTKIRGTNDPQQMIRTAIEELRQALGVNRVEVIPQANPSRMEN